jgi:hypothetical protein
VGAWRRKGITARASVTVENVENDAALRHVARTTGELQATTSPQLTAGGRRDLLLQAGPALTNTNGNVSFQLPVTYFKNYSTVSTAAWSGLVVQPTLTISFTYTAAPAMLPN